MAQEMPRYVRGRIIAPMRVQMPTYARIYARLRTDAHLCAPMRPGTRRCPRMRVYVCGGSGVCSCGFGRVWVCGCSWVCPALGAAFRMAGRICQPDQKKNQIKPDPESSTKNGKNFFAVTDSQKAENEKK